MEQKETYWQKLKRPTRIAGFDPKTFKEKWGFNLTRMQIFSVLTFFSLLIATGTILLLIYTPLGYILPEGVSNSNRGKIEENFSQIEDLSKLVNQQDQYISNLQKVIKGEISIDSVLIAQPKEMVTEEATIDTTRTVNELRLAAEIEAKEKGIAYETSTSEIDELTMVDPVKGTISQGFDETQHPGVDVVAKLDAPIKACLDGTVVYTGYSEEDGNFIILSHKNGLSSVYKHANKTLKSTGDKISKGDPIALVGNTGENSSGPHLHFELWENNLVLNPLDYLSFN